MVSVPYMVKVQTRLNEMNEPLEEYCIGFNARVLQAELTHACFKNQVGEGNKSARDPHLRSILPWVLPLKKRSSSKLRSFPWCQRLDFSENTSV